MCVFFIVITSHILICANVDYIFLLLLCFELFKAQSMGFPICPYTFNCTVFKTTQYISVAVLFNVFYKYK